MRWSVDGPPWPWMLACAITAFLLFVLEAVISTKFIPFSAWSLPAVAGHLFVLLIFAMRDVLFLQWCALNGFHRPVVKGTLLVLLYYIAAFIIGGFFFHSSLAWLTPIGAFADAELATPLSIFGGVVLQLAVSVYLMIAIRRHLTPSIPISATSDAC